MNMRAKLIQENIRIFQRVEGERKGGRKRGEGSKICHNKMRFFSFKIYSELTILKKLYTKGNFQSRERIDPL